jgi:sugar diacid utilization regulator
VLIVTMGVNVGCRYGVNFPRRLTLLGIMLGLREGAGFRDFVGRTLGELVEPSQQASVLRQTLKAYFDTNCNQWPASGFSDTELS